MGLKLYLFGALLTLVSGFNGRVQQVSSIQFLVTVNTTFKNSSKCASLQAKGLPSPLSLYNPTVVEERTEFDCISTIKTPWIKPGTHGEKIFVGGCDEGPLQFNVLSEENDGNSMVVSLVFHSSVIEDASPPACKIPFNGTYLVPTAKNPDMSLLPNCFVMDSREGYHMTYYWFKVFDWNFANTSED